MMLAVLPVTTATVERSFSSMKLIKTGLQIRMGEDSPESTNCICIEGSDSLDGNTLESLQISKTSLNFTVKVMHSFNLNIVLSFSYDD